MKTLLVTVGVLVLMAGCLTTAQKTERVDALVNQKIAELKAQTPPVEITPQMEVKLREDAQKQVDDELKKAQDAALEKASEGVASGVSGNWIGAALAALGIIGIGLGVYAKKA
jgi:hypothetical protein